MRVLVSTWGWRSHYYPMVPFAWGLRAAGHEVSVASQPAMVQSIIGSGLTAVAVGEDLDFIEVFASGLGGKAAEEGESVTVDGAAARCAEAMVDDLVAFGHGWRPDVVVHDPLNLAAPVAARVLGVPAVKHLWAADFSEGIPLEEEVATGDLVRRFGIDRLPEAPDLVLDPCPPAMQVPPGSAPRQPIRFVPYNGTAVQPSWLWQPPSRPRVCVTWGTLMSEVDEDGRLFRAPRVVDALAVSDIEVVVATDPKSRPRFGALPDNVRFADGPLALHVVLPSCQAVVHQGGAGSTMTALAAGVPQVILPAVVDQRFNAAQLALTGAGVAGDLDTVATQVHQLLTEPRWREAATGLAEHNETRPSPAEVAAELPRLLE
ncbi:nucleotide disphospho-sugar-binding domain-containing protein [Saccharopolyspora phatthalungensis]|uniref:UDP:flavonoid glycosyltransferase YjiC (YdhE family) n=1 Tax=Saccharopolyspora phatthalungensis TaxID=664693 RepID=A0A840QAZ5_9PSEU|nr:nucleotide disphospho-sugar-binding domain-containing protein [Saccharopolyspora phatthalungensis]MBB5156951.1 UDP:flavonoid glycosyltransferase YjiC (YdhE family) [Saccharopolyspora phatthalungensis]